MPERRRSGEMGTGTCLREGEVRDGSRNMPERRRSGEMGAGTCLREGEVERREPEHA
jgi:hypothetical protein